MSALGTWRVTAILVVIVAALAFALGWVLHAPPKPSESVRVADHAAAVHAPGLATITKIYQTDTVHSNHWFTRYDTVRKTDTIVHDSVVYVRANVADSTVRACRLSLFDCGRRGDSLQTALTLAHAQIAARDADRPSRLRAIMTDAALIGAGYVAGRAGVGAHISLRVPF